MMPVEVIATYRAQYQDPIAFETDEDVIVEREDSEFHQWFWCRVKSGRQGWVHRSFLSPDAGVAKGLRAYCAKELNVSPGERGTLIQLLDGWAYVHLHRGENGWLPKSHLRNLS
jgi:SH3-like domain-containing protein